MEQCDPHDLGLDERWRAAITVIAAQFPDAGLVGRVVRSDRGGAWVALLEGGADHTSSVVRVEVGASLEPRPVVGDWVVCDDRGPQIAAVVPRRTELVRQSSDTTSAEQVLAANVDVGLIVEPAVPEPRPGRVERLGALIWRSGARPVVVLTKADLLDEPARVAAALAAECHMSDVFPVNAPDGVGLAELRHELGTGRTFVALGPSGAGKSTLVNALAGREVLATGLVREGDFKGRHTSVRREAVVIPGLGVMIDTPGLRTVGVVGDAESIGATFDDIELLAATCRFTDCAHVTEPDCAVTAAVAAGELSQRRLESYRKLLREAAWQEGRHDAMAGAALRSMGRQMRARQREAMRVKGR